MVRKGCAKPSQTVQEELQVIVRTYTHNIPQWVCETSETSVGIPREIFEAGF